MKNIKLLCMVLIIALIGCLMCGCGNETVTDPNLTTITMWTSNSHSKAVMEKLVNEFNNGEGKELGIKFEYVVKEGDSLSKSLELALQTGQAPDILPTSGTLASMVENGYVVALDDLPGGKEFVAKYDPSIMREGKNTYKGKTYAVPNSVTTRGLIYNKDMFREAGIVDENGEPTPPKNFDEMREYAKKLTDRSKNKFGVIFPLKWSGWVTSDIATVLLGSVGHSGFNPVTGEYDYTGLEPIISAYMGMIEDKSNYPGAEGIDNDTARAYFSQGNVGMKIAFSFDVSVLNDQFPATCDWGVAPMPVIDENNAYLQNMKYSASPYINAKSVETKGGDKLLKVLEWYTSDKVRTALYQNCSELPIDWDIVKDAELVEEKTGWKEFAQMVEISTLTNLEPSTDMTGLLSLNERITNDILSGNVPVKEALEKYNKDITGATKKYYELHTDESFEDYINKDWNIKR